MVETSGVQPHPLCYQCCWNCCHKGFVAATLTKIICKCCNFQLEIQLSDAIFPNYHRHFWRMATRGQFHQHFMHSSCASRFTPILLVHSVGRTAQKLSVFYLVGRNVEVGRNFVGETERLLCVKECLLTHLRHKVGGIDPRLESKRTFSSSSNSSSSKASSISSNSAKSIDVVP